MNKKNLCLLNVFIKFNIIEYEKKVFLVLNIPADM